MNRKQQVIDQAMAGNRPPQIAMDTGLQLSTVYTYLSAARRDGLEIPHFERTAIPSRGIAQPTELRFFIDAEAACRLQKQAAARGVSLAALAKTIIGTVAEDDLFNAVLE